MDATQVIEQIRKGEGLNVEFKTSFNVTCIETLVAFANTKGGYLILGVNDNRKVVGIKMAKETLQNIVNEIKQKTEPAIVPGVEAFEIEGKTVVCVDVPEYPIKPVSFQGRYYKRVENSNHHLSPVEISDIHLRSMNASWDMFPDPRHHLEDLDFDLIERTIELVGKNGITTGSGVLEYLKKKNMLNENGTITNAAYLLFAKEDNLLTTVELGFFQNNVIIKDSARTKRNLILEVDEVMSFVKKHINKALIITGNPRHEERWDYPLEAIREIVMNMIVHRDYRSPYDSIVKVYPDHIDFYNPGKLPDEITVDDLLSNNYRSNPRNKQVADVFKDMGLIEKYGSGIHRVLDGFREYGVADPVWEQVSGGINVSVSLERGDVSPQNTPQNTPQSVGDDKTLSEKILAEIIKDPKITQKQIAGNLSVSFYTVKEYVRKLKENGRIHRIGPDKGGRWEVLK